MQDMMNFRSLGAILVKSLEDCQAAKSRAGLLGWLVWKWARLRHFFWSIVTGSDIDPNASIGRGLRLPHPNGVVIHRDAVIGNGCLIMQQTTIGQLRDADAPVIGSEVYIGAGAKVLGKIVVGDRARIGANAVVLSDIPADHTAVGVPARLIPPK